MTNDGKRTRGSKALGEELQGIPREEKERRLGKEVQKNQTPENERL
jgi:hypothetical protein